MIQEMLEKMNVSTKYPSIPTYHALGERGRLKEERNVDFFGCDDLVVTEKIDGTNARVIFVGDTFYIGSRENLLYFSGDLLYNRDQGIVETLLPWAREARREMPDLGDAMVAAYFEVYGGKINAWKQYTSSNAPGFRLFDVWSTDGEPWVDLVAGKTPEQISAWRESGAQPWLLEPDLDRWAQGWDTRRVPVYNHPGAFPVSLTDTLAWMKSYSYSSSRIDPGGKGEAEGVVVRNGDRSRIAKLRFEDYQKTLR